MTAAQESFVRLLLFKAISLDWIKHVMGWAKTMGRDTHQ